MPIVCEVSDGSKTLTLEALETQVFVPVCSYSDEKRVHLEGCGQFSITRVVGQTKSSTCWQHPIHEKILPIIHHGWPHILYL